MKCAALVASLALLVALAAIPAAKMEETATFIGMCDASAAAALDAERFVVADDEDNTLRVYFRSGGEALFEYDLSEFLGNKGKKKPKEADLEAATQLGSKTYWITSHGRNSKGKDQPERQRLFATEMNVSGEMVEIKPVGQPYIDFLDDLIANEKLSRYHLSEAAQLAPKAPGALNIEGLAATPEGHLLIGFRNPVPKGKALVVPLLNPADVIAGGKANLGDPIELDLQGQGIRSIEFCQGRYLIIAGDSGEGGVSRLLEWDGKGQPKPVQGVTLDSLNPEGIAFHRADGEGEYFILSDDGTLKVEGKDCKSLKDPKLKRFRAKTVRF
ncbi:DUF3616 domain-containing protein [Verrucomicrobiota bacterium sgz303538]